VKDSLFSTALLTVEAILNRRPLSYISAGDKMTLPICPADFVSPWAFGNLLDWSAPEEETTFKAGKAWHDFQKRLDIFWEQFATFVRPFLQKKMNKWACDKENLKIGDVVMLLDLNTRGHWPLAVIIDVKTAPDGKVRTATVRCRENVFIRLVNLMCKLLEAEGEVHMMHTRDYRTPTVQLKACRRVQTFIPEKNRKISDPNSLVCNLLC
jgi:hypothetical protein